MKRKNHLAKEKSPYLLQHAGNPVDWFPWCKEAFEKAKEEDKPVFLSIGYSTCHWCHVMAHESFEDESIARMMNEAFISIKVDREERPDIDGIYMTVCQMLTGSGGWPLTIIMTSDKKPFFAGTYFPRQERFGRIGMLELVPRITELWKKRREDILKYADEITAALNIENKPGKGNVLSYEKLSETAYINFLNTFDSVNGGFGAAPKFPTPHNLMFLLRYWKRSKDDRALNMVEYTLRKMYAGGIYDHIGSGFHRYSTDKEWLVPHFEKTLYDQALLCTAFIETYSATRNPFYKRVAEEILAYVLRDMTSLEGGFYSAEDADSEGQEGKFYLWKEEEIKNILGVDAESFIRIFNVKKEGNRKDHLHEATYAKNILHTSAGNEEINKLAEELNVTPSELLNKVKSCKHKLFEQREKKIHPYKDDKILTDWNALMISAFAKAYQALGNHEYLEAAEKAMNFILKNLSAGNESLLHRFRDGEAAIKATLDDYAFLISALIDLYESSFEINYLKKALSLSDYLINHFWDNSYGGFFFANKSTNDLLVRRKEIYDGAVPSGNSVGMLNLLRLGRITGNTNYENMSYKIAETFFDNMQNMPSAFTQSLIAFDFAAGSFEVVIVGEKNSTGTNNILKSIRSIFIPNKVVMLNDNKEIKSLAPYIENLTKINEKETLYVCRNFKCSLPVTNVDKIESRFLD